MFAANTSYPSLASDLGGAATELVGVESGFDESLGGAALGIPGHVGEDLRRDDGVTGHEVGVGDLVGQTQHANTDTCHSRKNVKLFFISSTYRF